VTIPAFALPAWIESRIQSGETPHITWQITAYLIMTAAEVMVSITALEFSYTQAPQKMKSFVMGLYLLSVAFGNLFTAQVNEYIVAQKKKGVTLLDGENYYWFFTVAIAATALLYVVFARFYRGETYIQGDDSGASPATQDSRCSVCGAMIPVGSANCPKCGEPLGESVARP
jgi:POT family proton-dependent oligopeptide transporter